MTNLFLRVCLVACLLLSGVLLPPGVFARTPSMDNGMPGDRGLLWESRAEISQSGPYHEIRYRTAGSSGAARKGDSPGQPESVRVCCEPPISLLIVEPNVRASGPPAGIILSGPASGVSTNQLRIYTATVAPLTTTIPITFVWQATGHVPVMRTADVLRLDLIR